MSFKREGNDANLLETLRKRRINELLSEDIPEDEAKLLCNGRFTCTVCPSHPVFDTVNVLCVHRRGKKHLSCLDVYVAKKRELKQLIAARKHQQYLEDGTTSIKMAIPVERGIITSCPYDPRVKKVKVKKGERRPILEIGTNGTNYGMTSIQKSRHQEVPTSTAKVNSARRGSSILEIGANHGMTSIQQSLHQKVPTSTAKVNSASRSSSILEIGTSRVMTSVQQSHHQQPPTSTVRANSASRSFSMLRERYEQSFCGPIMHDHQLKNIFSNKLEEPIRVTPYQSKFRRNPTSVQQSSNSISLAKAMPCITVSQNNALADKLHSGILTSSGICTVFSSVQGPSSENTLNSNIASKGVASAHKSSTLEHVSSCVANPVLQAGMQSHNLSRTTLLLLPPPPPPLTSTISCSQTSPVPSMAAAAAGVKPLLHEDIGDLREQSCVSEKLRQLQGSGWKRDWDGKWIKDENAEFDSDEEAPDIP